MAENTKKSPLPFSLGDPGCRNRCPFCDFDPNIYDFASCGSNYEIIRKMILEECLNCLKTFILSISEVGKIYMNSEYDEYSPIYFAFNNPEIYEFLLPYLSWDDVLIPQRFSYEGSTLLHYAAENRPEFLELTLALILKLEKEQSKTIPTKSYFKDSLGHTPLHNAASNCQIKNIEILLKFRFLDGSYFGINETNNEDNSILHIIALNCLKYSIDEIRTLVEELNQDGEYLNLKLRNRYGKTAAQLAITEGTIKYLKSIENLSMTKCSKRI